MSAAWFILFALLWTGILAGAATLLSLGRVNARFAQAVWRGAAFFAVLPLGLVPMAALIPDGVQAALPQAIPDLPYVEPTASLMTSATASLNATVSGPEWSWTAPALILVLIAGWLCRLGMSIAGQVRLQRIKAGSRPHQGEGPKLPLQRLGLTQAPQVRLIPGGSPFVAGIGARAIYVPAELSSRSDLRQIAIHECVHLMRGDLVARPLERLVADIFWFSPFAWMMRRELDFWREAVCDEIAASMSGDRLGYARTLAQAARLSARPHSLPVAAFIPNRKGSLSMRLSRLLEASPTRSRPLVAIGASLAALALAPLALAEVKQAAGPETDAVGEAMTKAEFTAPVLSNVRAKITSGFGERRHPVTGELKVHNGIDIAAASGTPVHAPGCGDVVYSGFKDGHGETVEIAFSDGSRMRFSQLEERRVEVGDEIKGGAVIGTVGMSGKYATGPHLHLEHWAAADGGKAQPVDPAKTAGLVLVAGGSL